MKNDTGLDTLGKLFSENLDRRLPAFKASVIQEVYSRQKSPQSIFHQLHDWFSGLLVFHTRRLILASSSMAAACVLMFVLLASFNPSVNPVYAEMQYFTAQLFESDVNVALAGVSVNDAGFYTEVQANLHEMKLADFTNM